LQISLHMHVFDFNEQAELVVRIDDQYSKSIQEMLGWSPRKSNYYRLRLINSYEPLFNQLQNRL
jgi:hypothetical protein